MAVDLKEDFGIVVVGAGPAGLLLALLLAKQGIKVTVLEKANELDKQPRASFYSCPIIFEFERAGIWEEVDALAYHATGVCWRYLDGTYITGIDTQRLPKELRQVSLPLTDLLPLMKRHLDRHPSATVLFEHEVIGLSQDQKQAWVDVHSPSGAKRFTADYIVGFDGGNSTVRKQLFGSNFPGKTWDKQIVATNVYMPKFQSFGWLSSNFFMSEEHTPMIAQMSNDGLLRACCASPMEKMGI